MRLTWIIIGIILAFLTVVNAVSAELVVNRYSNDFAVSSPYADTVKACACENRADLITITNTGNFYTSYRVSVLSEQPEWYHASVEEITLAPGEHQDVLVYAEPGCSAFGVYSYTIKVASTYGRERLVTRTLDVKKCQNVFLTVEGGKNKSNIGEPLHYQLTLKNVAEFPDTFTLDLGSFNEHATMEQASFFLVPDQSVKFNVTITPPVSLFGDVEIPFTVTSDRNRVTEKRVEYVFIENQYDHEIVVVTQTEICSRVGSEYTFQVRNMIDVPNDFDVIVTGPGFVEYEVKDLHLEGLETKNITLELQPKKGQEGKHSITIRVNSDLGDIKKEREIELDVFDCFAFELGFVGLEGQDGVYTDTTCCKDKVYDLNIHNAGQTEETYNLIVQGPDWFMPEEQTIRLKPSENRNVQFHASLPCTDETYEIPVTVMLNTHPDITETVTFKVESQTQRTCHAVDADTTTIRIDEERTVVPFIVKAIGLEGGVYSVDIEGQLYAGLLEDTITLEPGEEAVLHLVTKHNISDYFDGKYLSTITLTHELNLTYYEPFFTQFKHVSWLTHTWRSIVYYDYGSLSPCFWMTIVLLAFAIISIIVLASMLARNKSRPFTSTGLVVTRTILVIALIVAAVMLFGTPMPEKADLYEEPFDDNSGLILQWYENERLELDLDRYFEDPDRDWLEYTATQPANIAVVIDGNKATLIPEHNWAGTDRIVFTASDQRGGIDDSPIMGLNVLRRKELSFLQWHARYCFQITMILVLIILLALVLISLLCLAPRTRVPYATVLEPPRKPRGGVVHTVVTKKGEVKRVGEKKTRAVHTVVAGGKVRKLGEKKAVKKAPVKKARTLTKAQREALSKALDRALVSAEPHEMKQILRTHGKRETEKNIVILQEALARFKARKDYNPKNREQFYRYLKEQKVLGKLQGKPRPKPVKAPVKKARTMTKAQREALSKALDRALVSAEPHEMRQVLKTHDKRETEKNIVILQRALAAFKKTRITPKNRAKFYAYLKSQKILNRLENVPKVAKAPAKTVQSKAADRALVSQEPHEMRQVLKTHGKKESARNVAILQDVLVDFKKSRGYKPKNRANFYRYLKEQDVLRRLHNR